MKTKIYLLAAAFTFIFISVNAQISLKGIGGGLSLGSKAAISSSGGSAMGIGINVNGLVQITDVIDAEAKLVYYFPSKPATGIKFSLVTLNFNGHYNFYKQDKLTAFGLGGLNFSFVSSTVEIPFLGTVSTSDTRVGLNIGVGGMYELSPVITGTGEIGYTITSDVDQLFINLGILYRLK